VANSFNTVTITTSATEIVAADTARKGSIMKNTSSGTVFLGQDNTVTTSNGLPLLQDETFINAGFQDCWRGTVFGIVAASTSDVRFWNWSG